MVVAVQRFLAPLRALDGSIGDARREKKKKRAKKKKRKKK